MTPEQPQEKWKATVALLRASVNVRNGNWINGAPSHIMPEFLTALERNGWRVLPSSALERLAVVEAERDQAIRERDREAAIAVTSEVEWLRMVKAREVERDRWKRSFEASDDERDGLADACIDAGIRIEAAERERDRLETVVKDYRRWLAHTEGDLNRANREYGAMLHRAEAAESCSSALEDALRKIAAIPQNMRAEQIARAALSKGKP